MAVTGFNSSSITLQSLCSLFQCCTNSQPSQPKIYFFGYIRSSLWCTGPLLHRAESFIAARGLSGCGARAQLLCGMWDISSLTRDQTCVPCIARQFLNHRTPGKSPSDFFFLSHSFIYTSEK